MISYDNPNGASITMDLPIHTRFGSPIALFGNHPIKDRPQNM